MRDRLGATWQNRIIDDCERILARGLRDEERLFVTSRDDYSALEMIGDHVSTLAGKPAELERYLNSESVPATIRASFPEDRWAHVEALLARYGTEPHERERERVRLAILKISEGSEQKVQEHVATAKKDYRDVLFWADHPQEAKVSPVEKTKAIATLRKLGADLPEE